jgi:hypothetical protein
MQLPKKKMYIEVVSSACILLFGLLYLSLSNKLPVLVAVERSSMVNSRFYPRLIGSGIAILSLVNIVRALLIYRGQVRQEHMASEEMEEAHSQERSWMRFFLFGILCILDVVSTYYVGFVIANLIFLFLALTILEREKTLFKLVITFATIGIIFVLFRYGLRVIMPRGILF